MSKKVKKKNIAKRAASGALNVAGGTVIDRVKARKERKKIKVKKIQKEMKLNKKREELKDIQKRREDAEGNIPLGDGLGGGTNLGSLGGTGSNVGNLEDKEKSLENDIEKAEKDISNIGKKSRAEIARDVVVKLFRAGRRASIAIGVFIKTLPITMPLVLTLLVGTLSFGVLMTLIMPAGAFVVLVDEEDSKKRENNVADKGEEDSEYGGSDGEALVGDWSDAVWPVPHTRNITSGFGPRWGRNHNGIDIASAGVNGKPVVAVMDGVVETSSVQGTSFVSSSGNVGSGYGHRVIINHGKGVKTQYAHLIEKGIEQGKVVKKGDVVGKVGSTGGSTGPHLHFEIIINDVKVDPKGYIKYLK